ncbi:MAG: STN domain-containing protein [Flavobacteriales bacterium]
MAAIRITLLILLGSLSIQVFSQKLDKKISFQCVNIPLRDALSKLEKENNIIFSYSPNTLDTQTKVTVSLANQPLRAVLIQCIGTDFQFKESKNYIIISKDKKAEKMVAIKGYVNDQDGNSLNDVTVYDKRSRSSANTDTTGYFELYIKREYAPEEIMISKSAYSDTAFAMINNSGNFHSLILDEKPDSTLHIDLTAIKRGWDNVAQEIAVFWLKNRPEVENVGDTIYRKAQVSFVPFIGTNHRLSANCSNAFSFNILGGVAFSSRAFEFGGLFNMNRENAEGVQIAGLYNLNGGAQSGFQLSGLFGYNQLHSKGAQIGGLFNYNPQGFDGFALGGLFNYTGKSSSGFQLAGIANISREKFSGVQLAGLVNYAHHADVQIGFINIADSMSGTPIGFFNFVKSGYHKLEISYDSDEHLNLAFRSGVPQFYTILLSSIRPAYRDSTEWSFGYGIGTAPKLAKNVRLNFDLTSQQMVEGGRIEKVNLNNKFSNRS